MSKMHSSCTLQQAAFSGITDEGGAPLNFKNRLDAWVYQRGYPVVEVNRQPGGGAVFSQSPFILPPEASIPPGPYQYVISDLQNRKHCGTFIIHIH